MITLRASQHDCAERDYDDAPCDKCGSENYSWAWDD